MKSRGVVLVLALVVGFAVLSQATDDKGLTDVAPAGSERYAYTLLFGSNHGGVLVGQTTGTVCWNEAAGTLEITSSPLRRMAWKPAEGRGQDDLCPLREMGRREYMLRRCKAREWQVDKAVDGADDTPRGIERGAAEIGRVFHLVFDRKGTSDALAFDRTTISEKTPVRFEATPLSSRSHAMVRDPDRPDSRFCTDLVFVRTDGLAVEVVAIRYEEERIRAAFAHLWAGGSRIEGDRDQFAAQGVEEVRQLLLSFQPVPAISSKDVERFIDEWQQERPTLRLTVYVLELTPGPRRAGDARAGEDARNE